MPTLLDLYCCEGGAAIGYHRAGFTVTGVDITARFGKRYPYKFHAADAIEYVNALGVEYDAIHASPPCQRYSITNAARQHNYPDLISATRVALEATGRPYVIENVAGAPLIDPVVLCGSMFNRVATDTDGTMLRLERHRLFETNWPLVAPSGHYHDKRIQVAGSYGGARRDKHEARHIRHGGYVPAAEIQQNLLGLYHMTQYGMYQSLPPDYTEYIGGRLMEYLAGEIAA